MSDRINQQINRMFVELRETTQDVIGSSPSVKIAMQNVAELVSEKIATAAEGYIMDLYAELSAQTLNEDIFKDAANANRFYELNLYQKLADKYHEETQKLKQYAIELDESNIYCTTACASVGGTAAGFVLLKTLSGIIKFPLMLVIAGSMLAGVCCGVETHKIMSDRNQDNFNAGIVKFLNELQFELSRLFADIEKLYIQKVEELKRTL